MVDPIIKYIALMLAAAIAAVAAALYIMEDADAHEFYDLLCCHDKDCAPATPGDVVEGPRGYEIKSLGIVESYNSPKVHQSPDGQYHLCQQPMPHGEKRLVCIYAPPRSF